LYSVRGGTTAGVRLIGRHRGRIRIIRRVHSRLSPVVIARRRLRVTRMFDHDVADAVVVVVVVTAACSAGLTAAASRVCVDRVATQQMLLRTRRLGMVAVRVVVIVLREGRRHVRNPRTLVHRNVGGIDGNRRQHVHYFQVSRARVDRILHVRVFDMCQLLVHR